MRAPPAPGTAGPSDDAGVSRVALYGMAVSVVLATIMAVLAVTTGSLVLVATAVDTGIDIVGAVVLWLGLRLSTRTSPRFPYGLYKIENVLQIGIAILIFVGAYEISRQAIEGARQEPVITGWTLAGLCVTLAITLGYSRYVTIRGRRTSSPALLAEGRHRLADALSATLALAASISAYAGFAVDRYAAFPVVALVAFAGWGLLRDGMKVLLDASVDPATRTTIVDVLAGDPLVAGVRTLSARNAGRYVFVEASLEIRTDDLAQAHAASERLEAAVREAVPQLDHVTLHLEPARRDVVTVAAPLDAAGALSAEFGSATRFRVSRVRARDGRVLDGEDISNPHAAVERQKGLLVAEWLVERQVDVLLVRETPKKGPAYVLRDGAVRVRRARTADVAAELAGLGADLAAKQRHTPAHADARADPGPP